MLKKRFFIKTIAVIMVLAMSTASNVFAQSSDLSDSKQALSDINSIEKLADEYLRVDTITDNQGSVTEYVRNVKSFTDKIQRTNDDLSDVEVSKLIYRYMGEEESVIENLPEDKLLEALTIEQCIRTQSFIKHKEDGSQEYLSKDKIISELSALSDNQMVTEEGRELLQEGSKSLASKAESKVSTETISQDGYMKLTTTAYKTTGSQSGRSYYLVQAYAEWLKIPFFKIQDVLAITSNATYDNSYDNYGYYNQDTYIKCHSGDYHAGTNGFYENVRSRINKYPNINNTNDIWFEYSDGIGGIVLRFNMHEFTYSGSTGHTVEYSNMNAFLRYKVSLYNGDGGVQAAYGHKQLGIGGISVSLTTGSIGLSFAGTMAKYYGEPLSIYEYK